MFHAVEVKSVRKKKLHYTRWKMRGRRNFVTRGGSLVSDEEEIALDVLEEEENMFHGSV